MTRGGEAVEDVAPDGRPETALAAANLRFERWLDEARGWFLATPR